MKPLSVVLFIPALIFLIPPSIARCEVIDSTAYGFTIRGIVTINADSNAVYRHLVKDVNKWWDPDHTFSGYSKNLSIDAKANGCFCEKLDNGGSVRHMEVVYAKPGKMLRMAGALGPLQSLGVTGSLTFLLYKTGNGTNIEMAYAVGGYYPGGLQQWASPVDRVLQLQLNRLKNYIETGMPEKK
jgi:hypothetical protein